MSSENLERRIVQVLSCDTNRQVLERIISEERKVAFQYIASEFPILTPDGYGYLDIVGKDRNRGSMVLLECKADNSHLQESIAESEYYRECLVKQGLVQKRDLIGLYHRALIGGAKFSDDFDVKPLILDQINLSRHSSPSLLELFLACKTFMSRWIAQNYGISYEEIEKAIPRNTVPIYVVDQLENNKRKSYAGVYGLEQPLHFIDLSLSAVNAPLKLEPDRTHYETMRKIENIKDRGRFSIQIHRYGHSRPMLFFEVDNGFSACFLHTGRHQVELNGYYESDKVLQATGRIYGLIQAEAGRYEVRESKSNRVTLELYGKSSRGQIKINFLDRVYIDDNICLSQSSQSTLENH
jgi:hypothetical protein